MRRLMGKKPFFLVFILIFLLNPTFSVASEITPSAAIDKSLEKGQAERIFTDLNKVPWAENAVNKLADEGLIKVNAERRYYPERDMTRGEFVKLLINVLGLRTDLTDNFADVQKDDDYYQQLGIAKNLGIIQSESCNRFRPKDPILRQDMMVYSTVALGVAHKLRKTVSVKVLDKYEDKYVTSCYAFNSSAALVGEGLIVGWKNKLDSHSNASRASAAVLLYRIMKLN